MMDTSSTNKEIARELVDAFNAGDGERIAAVLAEDATWTFRGSLPVSGHYSGRDAILTECLGKGGEAFEPGSLSIDVTNMVSEGECVVLEWHARGRSATGKTYDNLYAVVLEVRNEAIAAVREYTDTEHVREALFT
jgi:ketosteroid isomerase-like protein